MCCSVVKTLYVEGCCNEQSVRRLDFSQYSCLETLLIGNKSFACVKEVNLNGLPCLDSVIIFAGCCVDLEMKGVVREPNSRFYLKNCPRVKKLMIGPASFASYGVCDISNVPKLETIDIGDLEEDSRNFFHADLHLDGMTSVSLLL